MTARRTRCSRRTTSSPATRIGTGRISNGTEPKKPEMLRWEYAREALKTGLMLEQKLGVNPFKFGMVGSTDAHTALAAVEEDNFFGKHSGVEPEPHRWEHVVIAAPDPKLNVRAGNRPPRLCRGMGQGKYARGHFRRHEAQGDLRDHGAAHDRALLWRLGLYRAGYEVALARRRRLREGRADGRRSAKAPGWASRQASWSRR